MQRSASLMRSREVNQVRRGEQTGVLPGRLQQAVQQGADAALAVGSGDVDELLPGGRQAEHAHELARVVQPQLDPEKLGAIKPLERGLFLFLDGLGHWAASLAKARTASSIVSPAGA